MSYKNLEVWQLAQVVSVKIHEMTLTLPGFEKFEVGQQIRRSCKSVRSNIVEGYGRRRYKQDFIKFLTHALASNDETIDHLAILVETKSLTDSAKFAELQHDLEILGRKLNNFIQAVEKNHNNFSTLSEPEVDYLLQNPESSIKYPESSITNPESNIQNPGSSIQNPASSIQNPESSIQKPASSSPQWQTLSSEEKYDNRWIQVTEFQVINPAGKPGIYGKVHYKNKAIGIVPLDADGYTWLVGQHRYTLNEWSWEIPEGGGALDADPLASAQRELKEETGLTANRWTLIVRTHLSNSVSDEEGFIFLAEELSPGSNQLEDTEADLQVWRLPFTEALQMVLTGKITDSLSIMGILHVARTKGL